MRASFTLPLELKTLLMCGQTDRVKERMEGERQTERMKEMEEGETDRETDRVKERWEGERQTVISVL